jgi:hypothetical protein
MSPESHTDLEGHDSRSRRKVHTEAETLRRLHARPPEARFTPEETALYLNIRRDLLRAWRWQERGLPFEGRGHFIRYVKRDLDHFMAGHAGRVTAA